MTKEHSQSLFRLIRSMTTGEKQFFKSYTSRLAGTSDKKFVILFDAIDKQLVYDEAKIISKYPALIPRQLPNLKIHLYDQLLKCIRMNQRSDDRMISEWIDYARVLYDKCLYRECEKMIGKVKKVVVTKDRSVLLLEILALERLLMLKTLGANNPKRVEEVIHETIHVSESIRNINNFSNLSLKLNSYYVQSGFIRNRKELDRVNRVFEASMPDYVEKELSFQEKLYLYDACVGFYFYTQDFKKAHLFAGKWIALFDVQPEMKKYKLEMYIRALNGMLVAQNKLYRYKEFYQTQKQLIAIKRDKELKLTENIKLILFKAIYIHEINRHFMLGEFRSGTRIVGKLENELNKLIPLLDKHSILLFYYKIACLYFGSGNYRIALRWLNRIINEREIELREDLHAFARILSLISHYELGNEELVEVHIRSTFRYFSKKGELSRYQHYILDFLKSLLVDNQTKDGLRKRFTLLKDQLLKLKNNRFEKRAFMYFDMISWLESKIENRPVQDIIKEKAQKMIY